MLVYIVYWFQAYFHVRITLQHLGVLLPHEDGFSKVKNCYIKIAYYSICDDYGVKADKIWMDWGWFYTAENGNFENGEKAT